MSGLCCRAGAPGAGVASTAMCLRRRKRELPPARSAEEALALVCKAVSSSAARTAKQVRALVEQLDRLAGGGPVRALKALAAEAAEIQAGVEERRREWAAWEASPEAQREREEFDRWCAYEIFRGRRRVEEKPVLREPASALLAERLGRPPTPALVDVGALALAFDETLAVGASRPRLPEGSASLAAEAVKDVSDQIVGDNQLVVAEIAVKEWRRTMAIEEQLLLLVIDHRAATPPR
jgi:hypothetical protein